jgi:hypothetical protein
LFLQAGSAPIVGTVPGLRNSGQPNGESVVCQGLMRLPIPLDFLPDPPKNEACGVLRRALGARAAWSVIRPVIRAFQEAFERAGIA